MKKYMWTWVFCIGILVSCYGAIFALTPLNTVVPGGYIWISLAALSIFFNDGATIKLLPSYTCSTIAGLIWGFIGVTGVGFMISSGLNPTIATCITLFILPFSVLGAHVILLEKTWFNKVTIIFVTLSIVFSQPVTNIIYVGLATFGGFLLGLAITAVGGILEKRMLPAKITEQ